MNQSIFKATILLAVCIASWWGPVMAQEFSPQAAVAPIAVLGEIPEVQRQIIFNSFLAQLSQYYELISQTQFQKAQDVAFEELDAESCTEEQCIRRIQEILQIESLFALQILRDGKDTQLSLTLVDLDKKRVVSDYCQGCDTKQLNDHIAKLVEKLVKMALSEGGAITDKREDDPEDQISTAPPKEATASTSRLVWHVIAATTIVVPWFAAQTEAQSYNDLNQRNKKLSEEFLTASTEEEHDNIEKDFDKNKSEMGAHKNNIVVLNSISVLGLAWEAYLLIWNNDTSTPKEVTSSILSNTWKPSLSASLDRHFRTTLEFRWTW